MAFVVFPSHNLSYEGPMIRDSGNRVKVLKVWNDMFCPLYSWSKGLLFFKIKCNWNSGLFVLICRFYWLHIFWTFVYFKATMCCYRKHIMLSCVFVPSQRVSVPSQCFVPSQRCIFWTKLLVSQFCGSLFLVLLGVCCPRLGFLFEWQIKARECKEVEHQWSW